MSEPSWPRCGVCLRCVLLHGESPRVVDRGAPRRGADACILDLEDSIPASEKSEARERVRTAAGTQVVLYIAELHDYVFCCILLGIF